MERWSFFSVHRYACAVAVCLAVFLAGAAIAAAQEDSVEYTLNTAGNTIALPQCFRPSMDLGGRGFHPDPAWPQSVAAPEAIDVWHNEFGACGLYRVQLNLWEISMLERNPALQRQWMQNYEALIKRISDAGGTVIVDIFSTPPGWGKIFDKKSAPVEPCRVQTRPSRNTSAISAVSGNIPCGMKSGARRTWTIFLSAGSRNT
jgi:hypothetical protein